MLIPTFNSFLNISFKELNNLGKKLQPPIRMFRKKIGAGKVTNGKWREDALILTETVGPEYIAEVLCWGGEQLERHSHLHARPKQEEKVAWTSSCKAASASGWPKPSSQPCCGGHFEVRAGFGRPEQHLALSYSWVRPGLARLSLPSLSLYSSLTMSLIVWIDMSEYMEKYAVAKLISAQVLCWTWTRWATNRGWGADLTVLCYSMRWRMLGFQQKRRRALPARVFEPARSDHRIWSSLAWPTEGEVVKLQVNDVTHRLAEKGITLGFFDVPLAFVLEESYTPFWCIALSALITS